ncbi:MAG TPA: TGS domain-containing protein, partial [Aggregatilineales bacterium]|nr:TGS domain-containing protein [Aggregatilineales bacterium]
SVRELSEAEYLGKTIHAMRNDVRVILIKLADRLHNMRTLGALNEQRQVVISRETMDLFAPLATRLGIWRIKSELEDLSFRYLDPENYFHIKHKLQEQEQEIDHFSSEVITELKSELETHQLQAVLKPNPRHIYSIYSEMKRNRVTFEETFGARSIRVVVDNVISCYAVLGVVHQIWRPLPGRFDDYIASPKDRFYQSLHTVVFHDDSGALTIQIRTYDMDINAELGIAAYWRYKAEPKKFDAHLQRRLDYIESLIEPAETEETPEAFLQSVIENIDSDRIYVLTPKGDILDLLRGATPIDFAYHIHTEVGHRCRGARVNGKLVPLDYALQSGDRVEIYTATRCGPNLDWLDESLGYVHTNRALTAIRSWFRRQKREQMIDAGRAALQDKLQQLGLDTGDFDSHTADDMNEILEKIGKGTISAADVISDRFGNRGIGNDRANRPRTLPVTGARGYFVRLARCCLPKPPDDIVGYVTRETKVTVHRRDCPILSQKRNIADRLIPVSWASLPTADVFSVPVEFRTLDRAGMMGEIGSVVAKENIN